MKDHYRVLGVPPTAYQKRIQTEYRNISKKFRGGLRSELKSHSSTNMKQLVTSYTILNDENKRKEYDAQPQFQIRKSSPKLVKRKQIAVTLVALVKKSAARVPKRLWTFPLPNAAPVRPWPRPA